MFFWSSVSERRVSYSSKLANSCAHPLKIAGIAIFCTGVGPSTKPIPPVDVGDVNKRDISGDRPIRLHARSGAEDVLSSGRESSKAVRGAVKGTRERAVEEASSLDFLE